jgi:phage gp29-like protein
MADKKISMVPPLPPKGEIISSSSLYLQQISLYRNTLAFGGTRNPTSIWAAMTYNQPETMAYYRELEDKDPDVSNCLHTLKLSVLERDRNVLPAPRDESPQAQEIKEFIEEQLGRLDFHAVLDCILDAPGYGFSVQEMIFDTSEGQAELVDISDCPQELFLFGSRFNPQVGPLQLLDNPWASEGATMPEEKFLIFSYRGRSRNRLGRPLLKEVFWPSWFKRNVERLWMQFAEKGPGTAVVHYNDADNASERQQAVNIAQALIDSVAVAVPKGFEFEPELLKIARAQDPKVYENFCKAKQYDIARVILGETLTSFGNEGGGGSRAQGQTHADTLDSRSVELCRSLQSVINNQLVKPLVLWNFGPTAPIPVWQFDLEEAEDLDLALTVDSGLQRMGKLFTAGYIADRYDRPLANGEDPDAVIQPNVSAPSVALRDTAAASFAENPARPADWFASRRISRKMAAKPSNAHPSKASSPRLKSAGKNIIEFAERNAETQVRAEMEQYDKLFAQLQGEAKDIFKRRVREVVATVAPPGEAR